MGGWRAVWYESEDETRGWKCTILHSLVAARARARDQVGNASLVDPVFSVLFRREREISLKGTFRSDLNLFQIRGGLGFPHILRFPGTSAETWSPRREPQPTVT